jgi:CRISPR-associated autoregulator DevR family
MSLWSISFSYRLGLAFHALNNEGADGGNLMQPRRIDAGNVTYDGISGEIVRHQIMENLVNCCREARIPMLPLSEGLHPDRGPIGIRVAAKQLGSGELTNENLYASVRKAIESCAVLDIGGYLAAWREQAQGASTQEYVAEKAYLDSQSATYKDAQPVKRDSCFDVAWLVSEAPQDLTITQHSAFRDTFAMNSRYAQTMRSNIYAGVIRADLHRVGMDDHWYLQQGKGRLTITGDERAKRQVALVEAIANFISAPGGAKTAAWAPHVFLTEGAILLTSARTAPFASPIEVNTSDLDRPVRPAPSYREAMRRLGNDMDTWVWEFMDAAGLLSAVDEVAKKLKDTPNE